MVTWCQDIMVTLRSGNPLCLTMCVCNCPTQTLPADAYVHGSILVKHKTECDCIIFRKYRELDNVVRNDTRLFPSAKRRVYTCKSYVSSGASFEGSGGRCHPSPKEEEKRKKGKKKKKRKKEEKKKERKKRTMNKVKLLHIKWFFSIFQ